MSLPTRKALRITDSSGTPDREITISLRLAALALTTMATNRPFGLTLLMGPLGGSSSHILEGRSNTVKPLKNALKNIRLRGTLRLQQMG